MTASKPFPISGWISSKTVSQLASSITAKGTGREMSYGVSRGLLCRWRGHLFCTTARSWSGIVSYFFVLAIGLEAGVAVTGHINKSSDAIKVL